MLLKTIIKRVNKLVGNSSSFALTYKQLEQYMDAAVNHINLKLRTNIISPQNNWDSNIVKNSIVYSPLYIGRYASVDPTKEYPNGTIYYNMVDKQYLQFVKDYPGGPKWVELISNSNEAKPYLKILDIANSTYDYRCMPYELIANAFVYLVAAFYLEEEDETEAQYRLYYSRAEETLTNYNQVCYCRYDTTEYDPEAEENKNDIVSNPYAGYFTKGDV